MGKGDHKREPADKVHRMGVARRSGGEKFLFRNYMTMVEKLTDPQRTGHVR